jgi:hypothetical protein
MHRAASARVSAAERSRYPGTELRAAWRRDAPLPASVGIGGYWSPHSYAASSANRGGSFNAWAATADWKVSLPARLQLSGTLYDGVALGGLSAGAFKDSLSLYGATRLAGLKDAGGWAQLKFKPAERLEFNLAFGLDNADSGQLRDADLDITNPFLGLARNPDRLRQYCLPAQLHDRIVGRIPEDPLVANHRPR